jgi:arginyl-tRNA synthetase
MIAIGFQALRQAWYTLQFGKSRTLEFNKELKNPKNQKKEENLEAHGEDAVGWMVLTISSQKNSSFDAEEGRRRQKRRR